MSLTIIWSVYEHVESHARRAVQRTVSGRGSVDPYQPMIPALHEAVVRMNCYRCSKLVWLPLGADTCPMCQDSINTEVDLDIELTKAKLAALQNNTTIVAI